VNEKEIERLMKVHSDSLGSCSLREPVRHSPRWERRAAFGFMTLAVATTAVLTLWPRDSVAGTLARVKRQVTNARTMEEVCYMRMKDRWQEALHIYYANDMWRFESHKGSGVERWVIFRGGQAFESYRALDFVTVSKAPPGASGASQSGGLSALDYAKEILGVGQGDPSRQSIKIKLGESIDGQPAYLIAIDQVADHRHVEILVDQKTDLPIQSEMDTVDPWGKSMKFKSEFRINQPMREDLFSPKSEKPFIYVPSDLVKVDGDWGRPIATVGQTKIRNVSLTEDGTIWIASTVPAGPERLALPSSLTDDLGRKYAQVQDVLPADMTRQPEILIEGQEVVLTGFVPLDYSGPAPARVTIGFATRHANPSNFNEELRDKGRELPDKVATQPAIEPGPWPSYFRYLNLAPYIVQIPMVEWSARAKALEKVGKLPEAAQAYERYAQARYNWVKYSAFQPMLEAARIYRSLGDTERADELTQKAEALKESRER